MIPVLIFVLWWLCAVWCVWVSKSAVEGLHKGVAVIGFQIVAVACIAAAVVTWVVR